MRIFKTLIISSLLFSIAPLSIAQDLVEDTHIMIESQDVGKGTLKKATVTAWYDFIGAASDFGVSWTRITNATLFPDTLVYQLYGAAGGGVQLGKTGTHSIGQVFDPKDEFVFFGDPKNISRFNPYLFDSLAFRYRYAHNVPGSVDTLVIQFYNNDKITRTVLSSNQRPTATVSYDKVNNQGSFPTSEIRILLTEADTSNWAVNTDYKIIEMAVPNGGMNVVEGGLCAVTMSYRPGYAYAEGDTIQHDWASPPTKKLNHFLAPRWRDNSQLLESYPGYNTGLMANTSSRYTGAVWNNRYIPGHAWTTYDECYYFFFHITAQKVSVKDLGAEVKIYPNPSVATPTIIEGEFENTTLTIQDYLGRIVVDTYELSSYNEINLGAGTYILTFQKDGLTYTKKLVKY